MVMQKKYRLAALTSHPIQYQAPLWRSLAEHPNIDLTVYFCSDFGTTEQVDPEFGVKYKWDVPLLEGYRYVMLKNWAPRPSTNKFWGRVNPGIFWELCKERYDAMFLHGHLQVTNWFGVLAAKLVGTRVFLRAIASLYCDSVVKRPMGTLFLKDLYLRNFYRIFIDGYLAIGSRNRDYALYYGVPEKNIFHCPYAVDNEFFISESDRFRENRNEIRKELGVGLDDILILFASKLVEKKNPMELLEAYKKLSDVNNKALLVVGDGNYREMMENFSQENHLPNVNFVGFQNQKSMVKFYAISDIFVRCCWPTNGDWGATVNESLACGLPVIATEALSSQADLVKQGVNGFIYPYGNVNALAFVLRKLIGDPMLLENMKKESRSAIKSWGYKEDVEGILEALEKFRGKN